MKINIGKKQIARFGKQGKHSLEISFPTKFSVSIGPYYDPYIGRSYKDYTKIFRFGNLAIFYQKFPILCK